MHLREIISILRHYMADFDLSVHNMQGRRSKTKQHEGSNKGETEGESNGEKKREEKNAQV